MEPYRRKQSPQQIGDQNRALVLNEIRIREPITRTALAERTGLSKKTITLIVEQLLQEQFVFELGKSSSESGRHPQLLGLKSNGRYAIGVMFEQAYVEGILMNFRGEIVEKVKREYEAATTDHLYDNLRILVQDLLSKFQPDRRLLAGTGIGITGVLSQEKIVQSRLPVTIEGLKSTVMDLTEKPVYVDNYCRLALIAEQMHETVPVSNAIYIDIGEGIGGAVVLGGRLYSGSAGTGVELGHMKIVRDGQLCVCGARGCLETYLSQNTLVSNYTRLFNQHHSGCEKAIRTTTELLARADRDPAAKIIALQAADWIGTAIANLVNLLAPERIIIGGYFSHASDAVFEQIRSTARRNALTSLIQNCEISPSQHGQPGRAIGAAYLPFRPLFGLAEH